MTFPNSAHDAGAQLAAARRAAHAWLRATLASLPAAVTSLSVGAVLDEGGDRPTLAPRLKSSGREGAYHYPTDQHVGESGTLIGDAMQALYDIDDDLRTHTSAFLFAIADEEWITVTRADLTPAIAGADTFISFERDTTPRRWITSKNTADIDPPPASEAEVLAAIAQECADVPAGESTTIRVDRSADGALTWVVVAP